MTLSSDRRQPLFVFDPLTGLTIEIFFADRTLESFGRHGAGFFWWPRRRGFAPNGPARGAFPTSYSAYRHAVVSGFLANGRHQFFVPGQSCSPAYPVLTRQVSQDHGSV